MKKTKGQWAAAGLFVAILVCQLAIVAMWALAHDGQAATGKYRTFTPRAHDTVLYTKLNFGCRLEEGQLFCTDAKEHNYLSVVVGPHSVTVERWVRHNPHRLLLVKR